MSDSENGRLFMKKSLILLAIFCLTITAFAFEYMPKNVNDNPFGNSKLTTKTQTQQTQQKIPNGMREIKTIDEYFKYLPAEVHRHWKPYKGEKDYEITVRFTVNKNGQVSDVQIVSTNYPAANRAVIDAVKSGAPYQPLPNSYEKDSVKVQILLEYHKNKTVN